MNCVPTPRKRNCQTSSSTPLRQTDRLLVCNRDVGLARLGKVSALCDSSFLQITDNQVGFNLKDRFSVFTESAQGPFSSAQIVETLVEFNTDSATRVLDCLGNWDSSQNAYVVSQPGLYQIKATINIQSSATILNSCDYAIGIVKNSSLTMSNSLLRITNGKIELTTHAVFEFDIGDTISIKFTATPIAQSITSTLVARSISIVQL